MEQDPAVLFMKNFESDDLKKWDEHHGGVVMSDPTKDYWKQSQVGMVR